MLKKFLFVLFFLLTSALQSQDMAFQTPVNISASSPFGGSCSSQVIAYDIGNTGNTVCAYLINNGSDSLVSILVSTDDGATWSTPQILSVTGQSADNLLLAFSSNGIGICVWRQYLGSNRVIQAARTTNGGITWSTPQIIETTTTAYAPSSLAIDNSGRAICYVSGPSAKAISTSNGGISWSTSVTLLASYASSESGVAMDNSGHGVCVFTSSNLVMATGTSDGGLSWSTPVNVSTSGTTARSPRIAYDQVNNAFCTVWYIYEGQSVQASKTSDVGNSWSTPVNLSVASSVFDPKIAFYNGRGICVLGENGFVLSSKTTDGGASWATNVSITGGYPADIQFDSNGVGLCLLLTSSGKVRVCRTLDQGTSWQTPIDISPTGSSSPVIALNAPNAVCIWAQSQGSNYILKSSRSVDDGLTWQTALSLTALNENANNPQISFDASGNGICVWTRFNGTNTLIQSSRTTNKGATWSTPQNISLPGEDTQKPAIKCGTNGNAICAWLAGSSFPYSVKESKTNDGGITWSTPVTFSTNGVWPQVGFDSNHNMFCFIWGNGSSIIGVSTTDNGTSWTTPVTIGSAYSARIDFDNFGNGICAMVDSSFNVKASKTINGGLSWSAASTFSSGAGGYISYSDNPLSLDFGGSNQAVCVWNRQAGGYQIQGAATADGGLNWTSTITLDPSGSNGQFPNVAFENGTAICVWRTESVPNGYIRASRSTDGGIIWQTPYIISSIGADLPQIDMIGSEAVAVWLKSDGLNNLVQAVFSSDAGASWTTPVNISAAGQDALIPQIAMYSNVAENAGMAALSVWTRSNGSNNIIQSASTEVLSPSPYSFSAVGKQSIINGMFQKDVVNQISWNSIPSAVTYRVYNDSNVLLYQGSGPYYEHGLKIGKQYGYIVAWVDVSGNENDPVVISLP